MIKLVVFGNTLHDLCIFVLNGRREKREEGYCSWFGDKNNTAVQGEEGEKGGLDDFFRLRSGIVFHFLLLWLLHLCGWNCW